MDTNFGPPTMSVICPLDLIRKCKINPLFMYWKAGAVRGQAQGDPERSKETMPLSSWSLLSLQALPSQHVPWALGTLSTHHHQLTCPNSLWHVHVLPSTESRLGRNSNTNCCFQRQLSRSLDRMGQCTWTGGGRNGVNTALGFKGLGCKRGATDK